MWQQIGEGAAALIPSVGLLVLFIVIVRSMILADRRERAKRAEDEAEIYRDRTNDSPPE